MTSASRTVEVTSPPLERPATRSLARPGPVGLVIALAVLAELVVLALIPRLVTTDGAISRRWRRAHPRPADGRRGHPSPLRRHHAIPDPQSHPRARAHRIDAGAGRLAGVAREKVLVAGYVVVCCRWACWPPSGRPGPARCGSRCSRSPDLLVPRTSSTSSTTSHTPWRICALLDVGGGQFLLLLQEQPPGRRAVVLGALLLVPYRLPRTSCRMPSRSCSSRQCGIRVGVCCAPSSRAGLRSARSCVGMATSSDWSWPQPCHRSSCACRSSS